MKEELRARFLPRFVETARGRVQRALELIRAGADAEHQPLVVELHSLAGEAAMLGIVTVADRAREAERSAEQLGDAGAGASLLVAIARALRTISRELDSLAAELDAGKEKARVLVVDDSPINAEALCAALEDAGLEARSGATSEQALAAMAAFKPSLVLLDVHIPGVETHVLCGALRAAADGKVGVLLVSGLDDAQLARLVDEVGADGYASKQLGTDPIVERVRRAVAGEPA